MIPFNRSDVELTPCPKCGGGNRDHWASGIDQYRWSIAWVPEETVFGAGDWGSTPEHLRVSCVECGYSYDMETADAKVTA